MASILSRPQWVKCAVIWALSDYRVHMSARKAFIWHSSFGVCFCNVVLYIMQYRCYAIYDIHFTHVLSIATMCFNVILSFYPNMFIYIYIINCILACLLSYPSYTNTINNRFKEYPLCSVLHAPFYVCDERPAMIKYPASRYLVIGQYINDMVDEYMFDE